MDKDEFYKFLIENYTFNSYIEGQMLLGILDYSKTLTKENHYKFLNEILHFIESKDIEKSEFYKID